MCGITGYIDFSGKPTSPEVIKSMTDAIMHRGPDGEGFWLDRNVALGHRRLSIIDPSPAGKQPFQCNKQRFVLVYNGEVYNYKDLKSQLENIGYTFVSKSDTEVVLYSLVEWGVKGLLKFNGMFALALWDNKKKKMILARDRYGVKPLYYCFQNNKFSFGSEKKSVAANPYFKKDLDSEALLEYFTFQNIFTTKTFLKDIELFPAGHFAEIDLDKKPTFLSPKAYWDYKFFQSNDEQLNQVDYKSELAGLLRQAVNRQLVSDVEIGSYLSGGLDSGSITAIASANLKNMKTFTVGFDMSSASGIEIGFDERKSAEAMSARFETEHYQMVLKSGDMERCMPTVAYHLEEPRIGQSYPNFYAAKLTSKFVKTVLTGTGGDELFGGYPWRYYKGAASKNFEEYIDGYYLYWQRLVDNKQLKKIFKPIWKSVSHVWTRDIFKDVFLKHENDLSTPEQYINHSLYFECKTFLNSLFIVEDKLSMAHGLENRVPFMDNDLVDFAMNCPLNLKLKNFHNDLRINENNFGKKSEHYFQKTNDGKQILREVMADQIPRDILNAKKQGFSSPDASWFKGESIDFVKRRLFDKKATIYNFLDFNEIKPLIEEHLGGKENRRLLIWSLLNVDEYLNQLKVV